MTRRHTISGMPVIATDFMFLLVLVFVLLVNPPAKDDTAPQAGNMVVSIAWPEGNDDVDLWVTGPGQEKATGYSNRGGELWNLLRDDLGNSGDSMPLNYENAYSRGLPDGEYIVNLHCFRCPNAPIEVPVEVRYGASGERMLFAFSEVATLRDGQELTVVRFRVEDGRVVPSSASKIFQPLRSAKKGGA